MPFPDEATCTPSAAWCAFPRALPSVWSNASAITSPPAARAGHGSPVGRPGCPEGDEVDVAARRCHRQRQIGRLAAGASRQRELARVGRDPEAAKGRRAARCEPRRNGLRGAVEPGAIDRVEPAARRPARRAASGDTKEPSRCTRLPRGAAPGAPPRRVRGAASPPSEAAPSGRVRLLPWLAVKSSGTRNAAWCRSPSDRVAP